MIEKPIRKTQRQVHILLMFLLSTDDRPDRHSSMVSRMLQRPGDLSSCWSSTPAEANDRRPEVARCSKSLHFVWHFFASTIEKQRELHKTSVWHFLYLASEDLFESIEKQREIHKTSVWRPSQERNGINPRLSCLQKIIPLPDERRPQKSKVTKAHRTRQHEEKFLSPESTITAGGWL